MIYFQQTNSNIVSTTLNSFLLPPHLSPAVALAVSQVLTGIKTQTKVVRYLSLGILHLSWQQKKAQPLTSYVIFLKKLQAKGAHALNDLAQAQKYKEQKGGWPRSEQDASNAARAASFWASRLLSAGPGSDKALNIVNAKVLFALNAAMNAPDAQQLAMALQLQGHINAFCPFLSIAPDTDTNSQAAPSEPEQIEVSFEEGASSPLFVQQEPSPTRCDQVHNQGAQLQVFDPKRAQAQLSQRASGSLQEEGNALLRKLLTKMALDTGVRRLHTQSPALALRNLRARFPNFEEVLDYIERHLALAGCGAHGPIVHLPPVLLRGAPGCGKTYFAQELARELGVTFVERDLSVATDAFVLTGMDSGWKNSKPGLVAETLLNGVVANPCICLNEIDKVREGTAGLSPLSALYALLEPTSAEQFVDEFLGCPVNASRVLWVLTANHGQLPEPLITRLEIFDVTPPTKEQMRQVALSVWKNILEQTLPPGHNFEPSLSETVLEALQAINPRLLRRTLTYAAAGAVMSGARSLTPQELMGLPPRYQPRAPAKLGFI